MGTDKPACELSRLLGGGPLSESDHHDASALKVASGGGVVLAASLSDRALRLIVTWLLSTAFGPELFGTYTFAITIASIVAAMGPLGVDSGAIYFGPRFRQRDARSKLKGLFQSGLGISLVSGFLCALILHFAAPLISSTNPRSISLASIGVALWIPLFFLGGMLRAHKDMRSYALGYHMVTPVVMLIGALGVYIGVGGLELAIHSFWLGLGVALTVSSVRSWRHLKVLYKEPIKAEYQIIDLLKYSIPQSLASLIFRLNLWMDLVMMGFLSSDTEIGLYKIASALAMMAGIPVNAIVSIFNPIISEHIEGKAFSALNALLKTVTRWLVVISIPIVLAMLLLPDLALWIFDSNYAASTVPLQVLLMGQLVWISCAPAMRIIPMSGHSMLNLINGLIAAGINIGLNLWLIPIYGSKGAAIATASTLVLWSLWRLIEVWYISRCFPFDTKILLLLFSSTILNLGLLFYGEEWDMWLRIGSTVLLLSGFYFYTVKILLSPSDMTVGRTLKSRILTKFRMKTQKKE